MRVAVSLGSGAAAEECGMDRQTVNRIENAHQAPGLDTLIRVAEALAVSLPDLVQEPGSVLPSG
ncbi:helix-turn-helix transcriptional regulator [Streptomyces samsunensis]|uniref:helix-turn-helix transcriptional regulator n=1 Tax=Streptomyces malaysiensis TaxID=92644 RepID=UPI001583C43B|nr:helix-turn-helix transcriptional regulator [Streptomyces samsunensis]NUH35241.1 helix-turn-helix transcriptional regulator [Streptomyces samsunensis]